MTGDIYCHKNGLKHINIINSEGFSALFVVNTPIVDNSGVAHGVEHMVFRRSTAFPKPETLFQLTSLTDAKINASTFSDSTYFHCQSQCKHTFTLAISYLLNGLFDPIFDADDLRYEIHDGNNKGVIYRELIGAEQMDNKGVQSTKKNANNSFCYGGISTSIGELSLNDLTTFHQCYYQASNITLVTANADIEQLANLIALLPKQVKQSTQVKIAVDKHRKKSQENENNEHHKKKYSQAINKLITVYHLWLQDPYYQEIEDYNEIKSTNKLLITNTEHLLTYPQTKLIRPLINLSSRLIKKANNEQASNKNKMAINHIGVEEAEKKILLPSLFTKLVLQAKKQLNDNKSTSNELTTGEVIFNRHQVYVSDQRNALWLTDIGATEQEVAIITSYIISAYPGFLAPRCQGVCYATQALTIENSAYLAIYSAFDVSPNNRLKELPRCLLGLSQDNSFISMSLALAKIKYCQAYQLDKVQVNKQVNYSQVMQVTSSDISAYLQSLGNSFDIVSR